MNVLRSGGGGAVAETDLIRDLRSRGYLTSSEIRKIQGPNMVNMFDVDSHMSFDRQQDGDNENMQSNRGSDRDGGRADTGRAGGRGGDNRGRVWVSKPEE